MIKISHLIILNLENLEGHIVFTFHFKKSLLLITTLLYTSSLWAEGTVRPSWYRYYDNKGIANVSTHVTPEHIKYGYQSLDSNMQVIQRTLPFDSKQHATQSKTAQQSNAQKENDQRLKRAYGSSKMATQKRQESLLHLNKQIQLQAQQIRQLKQDRELFLREEQIYKRRNEPLPRILENRLNYNEQHIQQSQKQLRSLQSQYQKTQVEYDRIIARLKTLE